MQKHWLKVVLILAVALLIAGLVPTVRADQWDKLTYLTFSGPVELPNGKVLPTGKYAFKLLDSSSNRHIVQIFDQDRKHLEATILAIPNERMKLTGKTVVTFYEMPAGQAPALRAWFYPGDNFGQEFAYPKNRAAAISAATSTQVPELTPEDEQRLSSQAQGSQQSGEIAQNEPPANTPPPPADQTAPTSTAPQETPAPATSNSNSNTDTNLPQTGSFLMLTGLAGLLSMGAGLGLRGLLKFLR